MVKASIIITTYRRSKILMERSLRSALKQNFNDYEVIVVNDYPNEILDLPKGIVYVHNDVNIGLSASRNKGIRLAKGKYVVCLDDDNELLPDFLKRTVEVLEGNRNIQAVAVGRVIQYKDFADYVVPDIKSKFTSIDWGWLIRKEVFDDMRYDEAMRANEDTDFGIRFFKKYKAALIQYPLVVAYDIDDPKLSLSFPNERELKGMTYFFEKNFHEYDDPKELWCLYRLMGRKFYRGGFRLKGLGYFWRGFVEYKTLRSFLHFFMVIFGWTVYDLFMTLEEKIAAQLRKT